MPTIRGSLASLAVVSVLMSCNVGTLFHAPPTKVIDVTPSRVVDSAAAGAATQAFALVISAWSRDATPEWTAHQLANAAWLALTHESGTTPDTLGLSLDPAALAPGTYHDTIAIVPSDQGLAELRVPVELRILPAPPPPPGGATHLAFTNSPPGILLLNGSFSVDVAARNAQQQTATGFTGVVSLTLQGPIAVGGLSGTTSVTAVNGIASFTDLKVTGVCTGCTLVATASGVTSATSSSFNVILGP